MKPGYRGGPGPLEVVALWGKNYTKCYKYLLILMLQVITTRATEAKGREVLQNVYNSVKSFNLLHHCVVCVAKLIPTRTL